MIDNEQWRSLFNGVRASLTAFFKSDFGIALLIILAWQAILSIFGYVVEMSTVHNGGGLLNHTGRWDGGWYLTVINTHYVNASPAAPAFYPLFPMLVGAVHTLFLGSIGIFASGFIVNIIASWLAVVGLVKIVRHFTTNKKTPWIIVALFLASPAAFFLHMFYGEAVFIALGFWAYLFSLQRRWGYVAILLSFILLARLPGVTFVLLCGLEYLRTHRWNIVKALFNKTTLWFLLVPVGILGYSLYLHLAVGDYLAMSHAYSATSDWTYYKFNPNIIETLARSTKQLGHDYLSGSITANSIVNLALPLAGLAILLSASIYALVKIKKHGIPLGIFGLFSFAMFSLNSHVVSAHRYVLPCIVVFVVSAVLIEKYAVARYLLYPVLYASLMIQTLLMTFFIQSIFAG